MQNKNPLVVFGCSWAHGTGVNADQTFGNQLSLMLGSSQFKNYAIPSSSNTRSVLQLLEYIKANDFDVQNHVAIFCITTACRTALINHNSTILDIISNEDRMDLISRVWISNFSSNDQTAFELHKNIICMQQICRHYQINDYYIRAWEDQSLNFPGIDLTKVYPDRCINLFGYKDSIEWGDSYPKENNPYVRICGHPSISGHLKIAQVLYDWIKDKIV
jgi:hypothetical protein